MGVGTLFLLLFLVLAGSSYGGRLGEAAGTVTFQGEGLQGETVEVYLQEERRVGGIPFSSTTTGAGGRFLLKLPPGEYYLWARETAAVNGPRKVGEYARNPVRIISGERVQLEPIELSPVGGARSSPAPAGAGVKGRVLLVEQPVEDAAVMIYDKERRHLMGPGYIALTRSDTDGSFQVDLIPGTYHIAVRKRQGGEAAGFLRAGDYNTVYPANPVVVREEGYTDIGDLELHEVDREKLAAEKNKSFQEKSQTRLVGMVVGPDGKPRGGQYVFVYRDQGMIGRPDFLTTSAPDGSFVLHLPEGGKFYLGARSRFGGPRQPGEWVGRLAGAPDSAVEVETGREVTGLTITMEEAW